MAQYICPDRGYAEKHIVSDGTTVKGPEHGSNVVLSPSCPAVQCPVLATACNEGRIATVVGPLWPRCCPLSKSHALCQVFVRSSGLCGSDVRLL